jgi:predicted dehydrogenase
MPRMRDRCAESDSAAPLRWGILGTGNIAATFVRDIQLLPQAEVVAVGSRSEMSAEAFGDRFDIPARHGSYESLVADRDVEAIYVSTPHSGHYAASRLALNAGKAVLCEKVFTINQAEAADLVALARAKQLFLMEGMWTRFLPHVVRIREFLKSEVLGDITTVTADHGQHLPFDPEHRMFAPGLGGGALLDLGVYPISFASHVLGPPSEIVAVSDATSTGVDAQTSVLLRHASGSHAVLTATLRAKSSNRATIVGTNGRIEIDDTWYAPTTFTYTRRVGGVPERYLEPRIGHGIRYQAIEVWRCIRDGLTESPIMPLDESISIMATLDAVRQQIGLQYPSEVPGLMV